jgi:hypothetical protein
MQIVSPLKQIYINNGSNYAAWHYEVHFYDGLAKMYHGVEISKIPNADNGSLLYGDLTR